MILSVGDSWTYGYGITKKKNTWPYRLSKYTTENVIVSAENGADNDSIAEYAINAYQEHRPDTTIIGWSGISRIRYSKDPYIQFSLSQVPEEDTLERKKFFEQANLQDLSTRWLEQIKLVEQNIKGNIIHFSVFGDQNCISHPNLMNESMLEVIAKQQGNKFRYYIPFFEFDFLNCDNIVANEFCTKEFKKTWMKACVERENIRPGSLFLGCGHPNEAGHKIWAKFLQKNIL